MADPLASSWQDFGLVGLIIGALLYILWYYIKTSIEQQQKQSDAFNEAITKLADTVQQNTLFLVEHHESQKDHCEIIEKMATGQLRIKVDCTPEK